MMIIGISLCRIGIGFFLSLKQLHHVIDHDNYKWSFGQQLCVTMTNFCTSSFAFFFLLLSFPLNLNTCHSCSYGQHKISYSFFHNQHFVFELLVLAYYKRKLSNQEVQLYSHILLLFFKGFSFFACGFVMCKDPSSVQHLGLLVAFPYLLTPSLLPFL